MNPLLLILSTAALSEALPEEGLLLDLDAAKGLTLEDGVRVAAWENQVADMKDRFFVKQDWGRKEHGGGRPTLRAAIPELGGKSALVLRGQGLVCMDEDTFDSLSTGKGHTCPNHQAAPFDPKRKSNGPIRNPSRLPSSQGRGWPLRKTASTRRGNRPSSYHVIDSERRERECDPRPSSLTLRSLQDRQSSGTIDGAFGIDEGDTKQAADSTQSFHLPLTPSGQKPPRQRCEKWQSTSKSHHEKTTSRVT